MSDAFSSDDLAAVRRAWDGVQAANFASDWDALEALITDDYIQLDPRVKGQVKGRPAWRKWADSLDFRELEGGFVVNEMTGSGDLAYVIWSFEGRWSEGGEQVVATGKGLALFKRGTGGSWRMSRNSWSVDP